jgi:hypothetical protein
MNKFEEAIQIAKGVTNFLRMKANIANNDIEELHKRRYAVCKVCEFRNPDNDKCNSWMSFAIKNALLKLPAQKSFESGYFIKAALLILKPALLILKCSLTLIPVGCQAPNNSKKPLHVRLVTGEPVSNDLPIIVSYINPPPKTEDFKVLYK